MNSRPLTLILWMLAAAFATTLTSSAASAQNCEKQESLLDRAETIIERAADRLDACNANSKKVILEMRDLQGQRRDCEGVVRAKDDEITRLSLRVQGAEQTAARLRAALGRRFPLWARVLVWSTSVVLASVAGVCAGAGCPGSVTAGVAVGAVSFGVFGVVLEF